MEPAGRRGRSTESALRLADRSVNSVYFSDTDFPNFTLVSEMHLGVLVRRLNCYDASLTDTPPPTIPRVDFIR